MTTFNVSHCRDVVLGARGTVLDRLVFSATVNWSVACRVFGQHTSVDQITGELPSQDGIFPSSTGWQSFEVFDDSLVERIDDPEGFGEVWWELKESNTRSVTFLSGKWAELSLKRINMAEAVFDVAKGHQTTQAWELTVSQPVTPEGVPCDSHGVPTAGFSHYVTTWMYWTCKSRDYWVHQKIKAKI